MNVPNIPNNSLTKELKELVELCQKLEDYGEGPFKFAPPATEQEIAAWEQKTESIFQKRTRNGCDFQTVLKCSLLALPISTNLNDLLLV